MEDNVDPKIQRELECLNETSAQINKLENELCEKRSLYRVALSDSTQKLNALSNKLGVCINKARPYYDAKEKAKVSQRKTQQATINFERAVSMHDAAREMVLVAEQGMQKDKMDTAWPEMLNHATTKVNEAEVERLNIGIEHQRCTDECKMAEEKVAQLQRKLKSSIIKSRPYFETKQITQQSLSDLSEAVKSLDLKLGKLKTDYSVALQNLEMISDAIHMSRGELPCQPLGERQEGVGAESIPVHYSPDLERSKISSNQADEKDTHLPNTSTLREMEGKSVNSMSLSEEAAQLPVNSNNEALDSISTDKERTNDNESETSESINQEEISHSNSVHTDGIVLSIASLGEMALANPGTLPGNSISST